MRYPLSSSLLLSLALFSCRLSPVEQASITTANFDTARSKSYFDLPFPSDALLQKDGRPDLTGYPIGFNIGSSLVESYKQKVRDAVFGFGLNTPMYFTFTDSLLLSRDVVYDPPVASRDHVLLLDLDAKTPTLQPLALRYIDNALGDPFLPDHTLIAAPVEGAPLQSGRRYAAIVRGLKDKNGNGVQRSTAFDAAWRSKSSPAISYQGEIQQKLTTLGIDLDEVLVATSFTTQDILQQRDLIRATVDQELDGPNASDYLQMSNLREVAKLSYIQGPSPNGVQSTRVLVDYVGGGSDECNMDSEPPPFPSEIVYDFAEENWPFRIFEGYIHTANLQGIADKPFASPGFGLLADLNKTTGRFQFEKQAGGALSLLSVPEAEEVRVVIQVPRTLGTALDECKVFIWDHGTGGTAYNAVTRINPADNGRTMGQLMADAGYCVVSRDQPLYGKRFPLVDGGYDVYLSVYNIANLTAFRDNLRQASIDGYVLQRWIEREMGQTLADFGVFDNASRVDPTQNVKFGHSLGSVTSHLQLGLWGEDNPYVSSFMSGSGGYLTLFFTEAGLGANVDEETLANAVQTIESLGVDLGEGPLTASGLIGALTDIPIEARGNIDRFHPIMALFQTVMDPADPMNYASGLFKPEILLTGIGDFQVPNRATFALGRALPNESIVLCETTSTYDPHSCLFREQPARDVFEDYLQQP